MLLLQRGALLKRRGRWIRCGGDCGCVRRRRGDAVSAMWGREGGKSGRSSGVGVFIVVERMVAAEAAVVEGVVFVRVVGAGAVGLRRMMVGKIFVDVGAGKGAVEAALLTANSGSASCGEGFEALFHTLSRRVSSLFRNLWIMAELSTFASTVCHFSPTRSARIFHISSRSSL